MTREAWILEVVHAFYDKAKIDILIGYHFRHITDFDSHIPRIASFWEIQLLGGTKAKVDPAFDVVGLHTPLGIKRGELGRWLLLFRQTMKEKARPEFQALSELWEERLQFFEGVFLRFLGL